MKWKEYKRYSREFKLESVRLASLGEKPKAKIARELGILVEWLVVYQSNTLSIPPALASRTKSFIQSGPRIALAISTTM